jgi:glycosyltransferase involved in cell wall biosynthesis
MRRLRILHVSPYYEDAWGYGGIPRVAGALARGLARLGHRVTVCTTDARDGASRLGGNGGTPGHAGGRPRETTSGGVRVCVFPNLSNRLAYRLQVFLPLGLRPYLSRHARDFDVAHVHGCHHLPGAIAVRQLARAGVPCVLAPNGTAPRIERRRAAKWLFDATFGRGVMSGASRVLAVTEAERRQLVGLGIAPDAIRVVPNPVDLDEFGGPMRPERFRQRLGLGDGPLVLYLGTLTPRKHVDVLVEAFAALGRPDARLAIAGNDLGAGAALRRLVARRGLAAHTTFTGLVEGRDRLDALAAADVVAYPGRDEIFGLVPLEALLSGAPVIVAGDSGCGEVVGATAGGLVVPPGDAPALAGAIGRILAAPAEWRRQAAAAQDRVRAAYGADAVCARLEAVYGEVIAPAVPTL